VLHELHIGGCGVRGDEEVDLFLRVRQVATTGIVLDERIEGGFEDAVAD